MPLILSRKPGESILIRVDGRKIKITAVETRGRVMSLSIEAERDIYIAREEIVVESGHAANG